MAFCELGGAVSRARVGRPTSYPLLCPLCGTSREAANAWLYKAKGSSSLRCDPCTRYIASRKWLRPCKRPWIQCETHRALGFACRGARSLHTRLSRPQSSPDYVRKRPQHLDRHVLSVKRRKLDHANALVQFPSTSAKPVSQCEHAGPVQWPLAEAYRHLESC